MSPRKKTEIPSKLKELVLPDFTRYFFLLAIVTVLFFFVWVISPFIPILIYAALITVIFAPMNRWFRNLVKKSTNVSALLSTLTVLVLFLTPLTFFAIFLAQEAITASAVLLQNVQNFDLDAFNITRFADLPWVGPIMLRVAELLDFEGFFNGLEFDIIRIFQDLGEAVSTFAVNQTGAIIKGLGNTGISVFILVLAVFFFFRDGTDFKEFLREISPLPDRHEDEIEAKLKDTIHAIVLGSFGTALLQAVIAGIGFAIVGASNVVFWITIMTFAALIPYVGIAVVWMPFAIALFIQGGPTWEAWFLLGWGVFIVSTVDNFVRPILIGGSAQMHPLATFLTVIGGLYIFGIPGLIFGPLILSLTITIIHLYQLEYKDVLKH